MAELGFPTIDDDPHELLALASDETKTRDIRQDVLATEKEEAVVPKKPTRLRPGSFPYLGLCPELCSALARKGYSFPTPIQRRVIPSVLAGRDVVAMARTGSGKTAAFLAPVLHRLSQNPIPMAETGRRNGPRALVLAPTRELALQTIRFFNAYGKELTPRLRAAVVVGGTPLEAQFEALAICPELVVATPGRLLQMVAEMGVKGGLTLSTVETLVLDEADRLFEGTLMGETSAVIDELAPEAAERSDRQTVLVSATMPHALAEFTRSFLRPNVDVIRLDADKSVSPTLAVGFLMVRSGDEKAASLVAITRYILGQEKSSKALVVFAATHRAVEYLTALLRATIDTPSSARSAGDGPQSASEIVAVHGNMDQGARVEAVAAFRKKKARVLVVTDVAARGIDLPELDVVVNYDMASTPKLFVHRVGRVGRAGRPGVALSLVSADEAPYMVDALLFLGRDVKLCDANSTCGEQNPWDVHSAAMETSFLIGVLPKSEIDDDTEMLNRLVRRDVEIAKMRQSSTNAHGLYVKTRTTASGESVRRAKLLYNKDARASQSIGVHPWVRSMESTEDAVARVHATLLSTWRPSEPAVAPRVSRKRGRPGESIGEDYTDPIEDEPLAKESRTGTPSRGTGPVRQKKAKTKTMREEQMQAQRSQFFVPIRRDQTEVRNEKALKVGTAGSMSDADGLNAFRAVQAAKMDIGADTNVDLLREKHQGRRSDMFWDRVSKKFVKGGVSAKTSKQNVHVATKEARSKAAGGTTASAYASSDGTMFKKWLSKNKKTVEQMRESGAVNAGGVGVGSNDFRKGAYGRKARIAEAAARRKVESDAPGQASATQPANTPRFVRPGRSELKSVAEIRKERKIKQKLEARRMAKQKGKGRAAGPALPRPDKRRPHGVSSKSKVVLKGRR